MSKKERQTKNDINFRAWKLWFDEEAPEECEIPEGYAKSLDMFRKLLLIRSWCPDRTMAMARYYIVEAIGKRVRLADI